MRVKENSNIRVGDKSDFMKVYNEQKARAALFCYSCSQLHSIAISVLDHFVMNQPLPTFHRFLNSRTFPPEFEVPQYREMQQPFPPLITTNKCTSPRKFPRKFTGMFPEYQTCVVPIDTQIKLCLNENRFH
jgi:hypothetical protein